MSSAAATSCTLTPGSLLSFTAVALKPSPYFATLRGPAFATRHLRPVRPGCQLNRGKFGVGQQRAVSAQEAYPCFRRRDNDHPEDRALRHSSFWNAHSGFLAL